MRLMLLLVVRTRFSCYWAEPPDIVFCSVFILGGGIYRDLSREVG